MRILTAIDLLGIPVSSLNDWTHKLICPWCHEDAWASREFLQCLNPTCRIQAASSDDLLAQHYGNHLLAAQALATRYKRVPDMARAHMRSAERLVLNTWVKFCTTPPTNEALQIVGKLDRQGFGIRHSRFGAIVLDSQQVKELVTVAMATGAVIPDTWVKNPPGASRAFCVQTIPHTIDRIILMNASGRCEEIIWRAYAAGVCSLLGLRPGQPRIMAAGMDVALKMQHDLASVGKPEEVASIHLDLYNGGTCPRWEVQEHLLTAVPRHCDLHANPSYFGSDDIVRIQHALDQFPGLERSVQCFPIEHIMQLSPRQDAPSWAAMRYAMIAKMIPPSATQMPPAAASIFEQTGTRHEDAVALIARFQKRGRIALAEDIERLSRNRNILTERFMTVKETADDYRVVRGSDSLSLSNFTIRITSNVTFRNHKADRYCQATLQCGRAVMEVIFPQNMLNDRVSALEGELQRQITVADLVSTAGRIPMVVEVTKFRQYIIPYLRKQAAEARPVRGVDILGWSENRKSFTFPGFVATMDGTEVTSQILCPSVPVLSRYKAIDIKYWADSCPPDLDQSCHDLIAMLVASSVRYFRRCVTQPILIAQSSAAMTVLDRISTALGQQEIHALNTNARDGSRVEGVCGYPLLAAGPRNAMPVGSQTPFLHLTDSGYSFTTHPDPIQAEAGGRAAQFCLRRVVDWCLSTGGDAFREIPALTHHRSLLREGRWLIENVCGLTDWTISQQTPTALEQLLAQIPYEMAGRRITLIDGQDLHIDLRDLQRDHDGIVHEARDMGTLVAIEGDKLVSPAVRLLPAISTYYGQEPDVTVVMS